MENDIEFSKESRKHIRTKVTKMCNRLTDLVIETLSKIDCQVEFTALTDLKNSLHNFDTVIKAEVWKKHGAGKLFSEELASCDEYEEKLTKLGAKINFQINSANEQSAQNRMLDNIIHVSSNSYIQSD